MQIDFYILEAASSQRCLHYACQLIEKAYAEKKCIHVNASTIEEAEKLDKLLWTYREDSFLPHNLYDASDHFPPPIQIGHTNAAYHRELLINFALGIPNFYTQFSHVIEIVSAEETIQSAARERYKQYREQGHTINTFKVKPE